MNYKLINYALITFKLIMNIDTFSSLVDYVEPIETFIYLFLYNQFILF